MARFITFLTDFGLQDDFVGTCHGVMKRIAPDVEIIDITHGIAPQAVLQGALTLANTLPFMPVGVHLAVVDPGVGGARRALALRDGQGPVHVGPDNGLLIPAAEKLGGIAEAHELTNPEYALESVSRTFHGRDLFSPAAAHLALGVALARARAADRSRMRSRASTSHSRRSARRGSIAAVLVDRPLREHPAESRPLAPRRGRRRPRHARRAAGRAPSATTPSPRGRSPTRGRATSSCTRTRTGTSRSRSAAATPRTMFGVKEGQDMRIHLDAS